MGDEVRPFSHGTEFYDWKSTNCDRCVKRFSEDGFWPCELEMALDFACIGTGLIDADAAKRLGCDKTSLGGPLRVCPERRLGKATKGGAA